MKKKSTTWLWLMQTGCRLGQLNNHSLLHLWYYCYNNRTCTMTTHYYSNLSFFLFFPSKTIGAPKFDSQNFNSLLKSWFQSPSNLSNPTHIMMNHKLSLRGSVWKSHSQPFFLGGERSLQLYLQHLYYKCNANSISSYSKVLLYCSTFFFFFFIILA
jgi:hypothetical protein